MFLFSEATVRQKKKKRDHVGGVQKSVSTAPAETKTLESPHIVTLLNAATFPPVDYKA